MSVSIEDRFLDAVENPGKWQTVRIADGFSTHDLESIRSALKKARAILDAFDGILSTAEAFISILKALESFINDVLLAALLALIDAVDSAVKEFKSTGIYALDLITPFIGDPNDFGNYCDDQILNKNSILQPQIQALRAFEQGANRLWRKQTYEQFIEIIASAFLDENDVPSAYISQKLLKTYREADSHYKKIETDVTKKVLETKQASMFQNIFRPGRPEFGPSGQLKFYLLVISVFDFLQFINILSSFSRFFGDILGNHQAVKELILRSQAYYYCLTKSFTKQAISGFEERERFFQTQIDTADGEILGFETILALGDFVAMSKNDNEDVFINRYAASLETINNTNKGNTTQNYVTALDSLNAAMIAKKQAAIDSRKPGANRNAVNDALALVNSRSRDLQIIIDLANETKAQKNKDTTGLNRLRSEKANANNNLQTQNNPDKTNPFIKTICGNSEAFINDEEVDKRKRFLAARDTRSVDFYGLSAYQLFPGLFDLVEELLQKVRSYAKPIATGISDLIDNIIKAIREEINNIRQIIDVIERVLQYIEDFLNLNGISLLALDSSKGTYGLVSQLRQAQGFQGQNTGKQMYFAGIMVGIGYPSLDSDTGVFNNVGAIFEAQKQNIIGGASNLENTTNASIANAGAAFNKFSQFFK